MKKTIIKTCIFVVIILATSVSICIGLYLQKTNSLFSVDAWESNIWKREDMVEDLVRRYDLSKMKSNDILDLLGTNGLVEGTRFTYYVGKSYSGPVLFNISFDENDYVSEYGIIID